MLTDGCWDTAAAPALTLNLWTAQSSEVTDNGHEMCDNNQVEYMYRQKRRDELRFSFSQ